MTKERFGIPPSIGWFLAGALAVAGCTSDGTSGGETGSLSVNIDLDGDSPGSEDETINKVQWVIVDVSAPTKPVAQGVINVSQPGSTASFEKFGLPIGGYGVQLTASSEELGRDGQPRTSCTGQGAIFTVLPDQQTVGSVLLNCSSQRELGSLRINGEFNRCAIVRHATVSPLQVSVGSSIDLTAIAQDDEGDAVEYLWTATGGTVADPAAATTTYRCESVGTQDITIAVSDDAAQGKFDNFPMPTPAPAFTYCTDTWTTTVECVSAPTCPNGVLDPGEDCDVGPPPVGPTWFVCDPQSCLRTPSCGDGIVDTGEACDPCSDPVGGCDPGAAGYVDGVPSTDPFCSNCQAVDACNPNPCDDSDDCTQNRCTTDADNNAICDYSQSVMDGTACTDFDPDAGVCISGSCEPVPPPTAGSVSDICSNNVSPAEISYLPNELTATPLGPVVDGVPVTVAFTGTAFFPAAFLNAAVGFGFTQADVTSLLFTATVRSGATGAAAPLEFDGTLPATVQIPIEDSNAACMAAGFPSAPCVLVDLSLPLTTNTSTLTPTGGVGGAILVGWDESVDPTLLPQTVDARTPPPTDGIRLDVGLPAPVGLDCTMGQCQAADPTCLGAGTDSGEALPDSALLSIAIN